MLVKSLNQTLVEERAPEAWGVSRVKMIKKIEEPSVKDFRPIAIIEASCKIFFSFLKDGMEEHLRNNGLEMDNQIGFTAGGRVEFNHLILQYVVNKTFTSNRRENRMLIVIAIDFKKAFDSVDRRRLVEVLIMYKIHPQVIDLIVRVYGGDETVISMLDREERVKVRAGIRQGCTASTVLFKLITFEIIRKLRERGRRFVVDGLG